MAGENGKPGSALVYGWGVIDSVLMSGGVGGVVVLMAGERGKPGSGLGYGAGIRLDSPVGPLRLEYAFNDQGTRRFHFGIGKGF
jgi:outer membrane protein assembly factor BamA